MYKDTKGNIFHIYWLEELILLIHPYIQSYLHMCCSVFQNSKAFFTKQKKKNSTTCIKLLLLQLPGYVWLFVIPRLQHARLPCHLPSPRICPSSCPLNRWCQPTISFSVTLFIFCLQYFQASESFPMSQLITLGGQSIGDSASASVLLKTKWGWFPLWLTVLISLVPRNSQQSSTVPRLEIINSSALCLLIVCPALTCVHDYRKELRFDYTDLCQQSNVFAFNTLSRFVTAFLPRSNHHLISWLQSPSTVILGPKKRKSVTASTFPPSICHVNDRIRCHDLSFSDIEF